MELYNYGLAQSATPMDCSAMTVVLSEAIGGNQPDGTDRRFVFKIDSGNWQHWTGTAWADVATQSLTDISVLSEGNTAAEVGALVESNLTGWVGKKISVAVAMKALIGAKELPSVTLMTKGKTPQDKYDDVTETAEISIVSSGEVLVNYFLADTTVSGGTVKIEASLYSNDAWGEYTNIDGFQAAMASKVKYRITSHVDAIGVGLVQVNDINAIYTPASA